MIGGAAPEKALVSPDLVLAPGEAFMMHPGDDDGMAITVQWLTLCQFTEMTVLAKTDGADQQSKKTANVTERLMKRRVLFCLWRKEKKPCFVFKNSPVINRGYARKPAAKA